MRGGVDKAAAAGPAPASLLHASNAPKHHPAAQLTPCLQALVRAAAWRALAAALDLLPPKQRRQRALPLLLRQCRDTDGHVEVQRALAAGFGALLTRLVPDMSGDADATMCLAAYRGLAWRHDHATRLGCAAAFSAVLRASAARRYGSHLHEAFQRLAADGAVDVRLAVVEALPHVAAALGRDRCCQYLRPVLVALLQDEQHEVQAAVLAVLAEVLPHFVPPPPTCAAPAGPPAAAAATALEEQRARACAVLLEPLLRMEAASGRNWRVQEALLRALPALAAYFTADQLHDHLLPLAFKYMGEGAAALRCPAAAAVAAMWRALRKPAHRTALYARAIRGCALVSGVWGQLAVACVHRSSAGLLAHAP